MDACVHACVRACVRASERDCVRACERACAHERSLVRGCVHGWVRVCVRACACTWVHTRACGTFLIIAGEKHRDDLETLYGRQTLEVRERLRSLPCKENAASTGETDSALQWQESTTSADG